MDVPLSQCNIFKIYSLSLAHTALHLKQVVQKNSFLLVLLYTSRLEKFARLEVTLHVLKQLNMIKFALHTALERN